jgi:hypothetical protein
MPSERAGDNWLNDKDPVRPSGPAPKPKQANLRRHPRFSVDGAGATLYFKGVLSLVGLGGSSKARGLLNLSEGGALLICTEEAAPGRKVKVRVDMEKYQDVFEAEGVVKRCSRSARREGEFHIGLQFTDVDGAQKRKLVKMREWFTSPEYKTMAALRNKQSGSIEFFR